MSTTTPYADAWRERTRQRIEAAGLRLAQIIEQTGLYHLDVCEAVTLGPVSLEIAGPIDELLAQLEATAEDRALDELLLAAEIEIRTPNGRADFEPVKLERVAVDLGKLCDCDVVLHGSRDAR